MTPTKEKEELQYVSVRTGSGALVLTEFYMYGDDEEDHFIAIKPIEVITIGYNQDEDSHIRENLIYRKYIRFSDDEECPITDIETVSKLSPDAENYYLSQVTELYPKTETEVETKEPSNHLNVITGNFANTSKKPH